MQSERNTRDYGTALMDPRIQYAKTEDGVNIVLHAAGAAGQKRSDTAIGPLLAGLLGRRCRRAIFDPIT